jgi:hypothetical protein
LFLYPAVPVLSIFSLGDTLVHPPTNEELVDTEQKIGPSTQKSLMKGSMSPQWTHLGADAVDRAHPQRPALGKRLVLHILLNNRYITTNILLHTADRLVPLQGTRQ